MLELTTLAFPLGWGQQFAFLGHVKNRSQPRFHLGGLESERPSATAIRDLSVLAHDVKTIGPRLVSFADFVIEPVHEGTNLEIQCRAAHVGYFLAFFESFGVFEELPFDGNGPAVFGVCFANVDYEEGGLAFVVLVEFFQVARLATEGRSGVASENQHDWFFRAIVGQLDCLAWLAVFGFREVVGFEEFEVESRSDFSLGNSGSSHFFDLGIDFPAFPALGVDFHWIGDCGHEGGQSQDEDRLTQHEISNSFV